MGRESVGLEGNGTDPTVRFCMAEAPSAVITHVNDLLVCGHPSFDPPTSPRSIIVFNRAKQTCGGR